MSWYVKLRYVVQCYGMLCHVLPSFSMLCYDVLCHVMMCDVMLFVVMLCLDCPNPKCRIIVFAFGNSSAFLAPFHLIECVICHVRPMGRLKRIPLYNLLFCLAWYATTRCIRLC